MFDEVLSRVRERVEGAKAVLLIAADGMVVAGAGQRSEDWDLLAASYADLARKTRQLQRDLDLDAPREWVVSSAGSTVVLRGVAEGYLLLADLEPDGSLGRTRFELRKAADALDGELRD